MANTEVLPSVAKQHRTPTGSESKSTEAFGEAVSESSSEPTLVEIAIPVYNEEDVLESSIRRLRTYLDRSFPFSASIVIVDNASTDRTWEIAMRLCGELPLVGAIHLDQKGRGRAIRSAWTASRSEVVAYMDVDLSTDLDGLLPLVAPLLSGHSQVAIGSRIASGSRVLRGAKREFISRSYNLILRSTLRCRFSDAQCGFKAMRRDAVEPLMALIEDQAWFFDTELLIQAEWNGLRIHEVSVDWIDDPDTRVHIASTAREDLRGVWRLARQRQEGGELRRSQPSSRDEAFEYHHQMARYASVGILSTVAYLALFLLLRNPLGMFAANLVAAAATALVNTLAHASFTFRAKQGGQVRQAVVVGACSFAVGIGLTTLALAATYVIGRTSSVAEGIAILVGMVVASCVRFVLLREWAYRNHTRTLRTEAEPIIPPHGERAKPEAA
jgi:glycosyltransferase involved in cell wall biosynthesis